MTLDHPAPGLVVAQPDRGFRYAVDSFWLAGFALEVGEGRGSALDLGTGSGIVAMLLGGCGVPTTGLDHRPEWAPLWRETLARSVTAAPVSLVLGDIGEGVPGPVELAVSNPPYFAPERGPVSPDPWKRAARTESTVTLPGFVRIATSALAPGGRACFVIDRGREEELLAARDGRRVVRWVRVGRRRTLVCLGAEPGADAAPEPIGQDDPLLGRWLALARRG